MIDRKNPSVVIPTNLLAALDSGAKRRDMNRSQAVRDAIRTWLRVNGLPEPSIQPEAEKAS